MTAPDVKKPNGGLFIPLEIVKREYSSKLLLSVEMAYRGMPVFIGHKSSVIRIAKSASQPGILFYKSAKWVGFDFFDDLEKKGFAIVAQDEEAGIVQYDFSNFYNSRLSLRNAGDLDLFFCWGKDDFDFITKRIKGNKKGIQLTGSPRTCFWGQYGRKYYNNAINRIKKKYGPFIFFVSNFASGNSYLSSKQTDTTYPSWTEKYPEWLENQKKRGLETIKFDNRMIQVFIDASKRISEERNTRIIIRPHPTENMEKWKKLTKNMSNVSVEAKGDITPWILAAECVVQNGCTSGVEAACANVPTIAFGETEADLFLKDNTVPNLCAIPAIGVDNLMDIIRNFKEAWDADSNRRKELFDRKIYNAGTLQPVYDIADRLIFLSGPPNQHVNEKLGRDSFFYDVLELYRMSRFRRRSTGVIMDQAKRPTISPKQLSDDVKKMMFVLDYDFDMEVVRVAPNCFRICRKYR